MATRIVLLAAFAAAAAPQHGRAASPALADQVHQLEEALQHFKLERASALEKLKAENHIQEDALRAKIWSVQEKEDKINSSRRLSTADNAAAIAATAAAIGDETSALNHTWLILCGALVMFMQAGFAMIEAGTCQAKNTQSIMLKNFIDVCAGTLCWWAVGWTLAYGIGTGDNDAFANDDQPFGMGFNKVDKDGNQTPSDMMMNWFFQWAFCSAASTIVSGAVAERVQYRGYVLFTVLMTCVIYPCVVHWTWGYGWLSGGDDYHINKTGFMDFAGSGIVHMTGGVAGLVGATIVGPRAGRFITNQSFEAHSVPLVVLGTFILWFGWYGFNCGSTLGMGSADVGQMAAQVAMNTTLAAASGGLTVLGLRFLIYKTYDVCGMCNGILAGLVSITAGCGNVECGSALAIGIIGGFVYQAASALLVRLQIDDPIDAFPVHGAAGAWGVLASALFDWGQGVDKFNGWSGWSCVAKDNGDCQGGAWGEAMTANVVEVLVICTWTAGLTLMAMLPMRILGLLRAGDEHQAQGMDAVKHAPSTAYESHALPRAAEAPLATPPTTPPQDAAPPDAAPADAAPADAAPPDAA